MSLKKDFASGVFYTSIAKYSGLVVQVLITSVLARLLTPRDFGVIAIATVLIQFFNTISEAGIGPAILVIIELQKNDLNSIFTFTVVLGIVLGLGFFFCSSLIAKYYDDDQLKPACEWLSLLILFSSADIVTNSLLLKQKKFKIIAIRTITVQIITGVLSIYTAWIGWGIYSLIFSAVSSKIIIFIVNYLQNPLWYNFSFSSVKTIRSYSAYQFCFNLVNYFSRNFDKLIIGKFIGMNQLGYYEKSYRLMMLPLSNITYVLTPVIHPIFSELQNDNKKIIDNYLKLIKYIGCLSFPLIAFLFFNAREIILLFFGNQWEASIVPFKILSLTAGLQVIHATSSGIFQATNNTKGLFWASIINAILMIAGFVVSAVIFKTIEAVSYSFLITCTIGSLIVYIIMFRDLNEDITKLFFTLKIPLLIGILVFVVLSFTSYIIPWENILINFVVKTMVVLFFTILLIQLFGIIDIKMLFKQIKK